jgi:pimeloyl-ACP methyl ester carboxylesterase
MKNIYLLSGLGADKRVFDFVDFSGFKVNHVDWIAPTNNESIERYAKRLVGQIKTNRPIIIGVSFGGIMAVEIAKQIETEAVILISSAKTRFEIPFYFRIIGQLGLSKLVPPSIFKTVNNLTYWFFGTKTKKENELLKAIIKETDNKFLKWAIDKIVNWRNKTMLTNLTHIHGTDDKILPLKTADFKVSNGGHLMIVNKGKDIAGIVRQILG